MYADKNSQIAKLPLWFSNPSDIINNWEEKFPFRENRENIYKTEVHLSSSEAPFSHGFGSDMFVNLLKISWPFFFQRDLLIMDVGQWQNSSAAICELDNLQLRANQVWPILTILTIFNYAPIGFFLIRVLHFYQDKNRPLIWSFLHYKYNMLCCYAMDR